MLLSPATNGAIVQLPDRKFPGVVVQGDTLNNLIGMLQSALTGHEGMEWTEEALGILIGMRAHYEAVCTKIGSPLPY